MPIVSSWPVVVVAADQPDRAGQPMSVGQEVARQVGEGVVAAVRQWPVVVRRVEEVLQDTTVADVAMVVQSADWATAEMDHKPVVLMVPAAVAVVAIMVAVVAQLAAAVAAVAADHPIPVEYLPDRLQ